ncbi:MAG: 50S ribosomal protein L11 methyltransferase [Verrucomicrobiales bacterium]|nr:50S ribosomal protein L11 methyltransferase [Verrucomicrobiales bacterium]
MSAIEMVQVRVRVPGAAEGVVSGLFAVIFGEDPVSYTDAETGVTEVSLYRPAVQAPAAGELETLKEALRRARSEGLLPLFSPRVSVRRLRPQDWAESWRRHFKARVFGNRVLVRPSWSRRRPRRGEVEVVLDPGLSFGTGQHATTAFCLEQIAVAAARAKGRSLSLLDVGTGSGILAIAAAKLGYGPVEAFDFDPDAVRIAGENARANGIDLHPRRRDVRRLSLSPRRRFDVVAANLLADLLIAERDRLVAQVPPGGVLLLAGILKTQFAAVRRAYEGAGLRLRAERAEREWQSGAYCRKAF